MKIKFYFFSFLLLSLIISSAASSMTEMFSSFAISTICESAAFKNMRGILVSFAQASSVNVTAGSMRFAAYLTELISPSFACIFSGNGFLKGEHQKLVLSR